MITELLPLTENKLKILKFIYEQKETHLQEIARKLSIHPYSVQKTLKTLKPALEQQQAGKTILLKINTTSPKSSELISTVESYKQQTPNKTTRLLIKKLQELYSDRSNILAIILCGSYARSASTESSDIDLLVIAKKKEKEITTKCTNLESLIGKEINPSIMNEKEFTQALSIKEPTMKTIIEPSQRIIMVGIDYFLKKTG